MNHTFHFDVPSLKRILYTMLAALFVVAGLPMLQPKAAAAQFSTRSIQLSDSGVSGGSITSGVGSGTNVTYRVSFTPTAAVAQSMVIDFCTQDPIINDTCTAPTGMTAATGLSNVSGTAGGTGWSLTASAGRAKISSDANPAHNIVGATPQIFDLTGITNPSTTGTFFARMYSYANNSWGTYSSATSVGNFVDYGGTAIAITNTVTITARVQEQLTYCVTTADPTTWVTQHDCSDSVVGSNPPNLTLGHGSPTPVLDSNNVDEAAMYSQLSTNATHGAVINMRSSNTSCGGLSADAGATCAIPATNGGSNAGATAITAGTAAFGLFVSNSTADPAGGIGTITPSTIYHNASHVTIPTDLWYGMDTTTSTGAFGGGQAAYTGSVTGTFGSTVASSNAPCYRVENTYVFAATAALTTPAGIYTSNLSMIATGTF
jgi:hypothetical protein